MLRHNNTFKHARVRRLVARLRSDYPLLLFLPFFLLGQVGGFYITGYAWVALCCSLALAVLARVLKRRFSAAVIAICVLSGGIFSMCISLEIGNPAKLDSEISYIAQIDKRPRFKAAGSVEISASIMAQLRNAGSNTTIEDLSSPVRVLCKGVDLPWKNATNARLSDIIAIKGTFRPIEKSLNPFDYKSTLYRHEYRDSCRLRYLAPLVRPAESLVEQARLDIIHWVRQLLGDNEITGLFLAMSIGVPDAITDTTENAFKRTGLAHLLVVSGAQVTLVFGAAVIIFKFLLSRFGHRLRIPVMPVCTILGVLCAAGFVELSGIEGSSLRAVFAILSVVISLITERSLGMFHAILNSLLLVSIVWPGAIFEPGIQLTYAALVGICIGQQTNITQPLLIYLRIRWCASLFTSLVVACWFGMFSITGFLLNPLLATPASIVSCNFGLLAIIAYISGVDSAGHLLRLCAWLLSCMREAIVWVSDFSFAGVEIEGAVRATVIAVLAIWCAKLIFGGVKRYYNARVA